MRATTALVVATGGVCRSIGPWVLVAALLLFLAEVREIVQLGVALWPIPLSFLVLGLVHEYGHIVAVRWLGGQVESVDPVGSAAIRIGFTDLSSGRAWLVVVAGPLTAFVFGWAAGLIGWPSPTAFFLIAGGSAHLISLALPIGDGLELRRLRPTPGQPPGIARARQMGDP